MSMKHLSRILILAIVLGLGLRAAAAEASVLTYSAFPGMQWGLDYSWTQKIGTHVITVKGTQISPEKLRAYWSKKDFDVFFKKPSHSAQRVAFEIKDEATKAAFISRLGGNANTEVPLVMQVAGQFIAALSWTLLIKDVVDNHPVVTEAQETRQTAKTLAAIGGKVIYAESVLAAPNNSFCLMRTLTYHISVGQEQRSVLLAMQRIPIVVE